MHPLHIEGDVLEVSKIICLARNYAEHAKELGNVVPTQPVFFLKPPSCLLFGGGEIRMPTDIGRVDVETELVDGFARLRLCLPRDQNPTARSDPRISDHQ